MWNTEYKMQNHIMTQMTHKAEGGIREVDDYNRDGLGLLLP